MPVFVSRLPVFAGVCVCVCVFGCVYLFVFVFYVCSDVFVSVCFRDKRVSKTC